jgi:hypothetical protein
MEWRFPAPSVTVIADAEEILSVDWPMDRPTDTILASARKDGKSMKRKISAKNGTRSL